MGGGSKYLMDKSRNGSRGDGLNVDLEWKELGGNRTILRTVDDLTQLNVAEDEKLLGKSTATYNELTRRHAV